MVDQTLVERKIATSVELAEQLVGMDAPLLAAYWEWHEEKERWTLLLVPKSRADERTLIDVVVSVLREPRYRAVFSIFDVMVDARQGERARALGEYLRRPDYVGRRVDHTFTGGHYFESVVLVYLAPEIAPRHHVA